MNAIELRFFVPLRSGGHTTLIVQLFPGMARAVPFISAKAEGLQAGPAQCNVGSLYQAVQCLRAIMKDIEHQLGPLDYRDEHAREDAAHFAGAVVFFAMQSTPGTRLIRPPIAPGP